MFREIIGGISLIISPISGSTSTGRPDSTWSQQSETASPDLTGLADRFCIGPDGDQELTWAIAVSDGYEPLSPEDFPGLRLPGIRQLKGFSRQVGGTEVRVLTGVNRIWMGSEELQWYFNLCWVSVAPADRDSIDREFRDYMDMDRFRQKDAFVYAWIPQQDGTRRSVRRSDFASNWIRYSRFRGMRTVMTNEYNGRVSITYMRPADSCADWCY